MANGAQPLTVWGAQREPLSPDCHNSRQRHRWALFAEFKLPWAEHFRTADGAADVAHGRVSGIPSLFPLDVEGI